MKRVYLHVAVEGDRTLYRTFVEKAHAVGIEVYFLFGQPRWITNEGTTARPNVEDPLAWIDLSAYQQETISHPDGISVDLEPYALPNGRRTNHVSSPPTNGSYSPFARKRLLKDYHFNCSSRSGSIPYRMRTVALSASGQWISPTKSR